VNLEKNKCINKEIITKCKIIDLSTFKKPLRCGERYLRDINIKWVLKDYFSSLCPNGEYFFPDNRMNFMIYIKK